MSTKSLFLLSLACVILVLVKCEENPGRLIACWTEKLKYEKFQMGLYFSSRNKKNQYFREGTIFRPQDFDYDPRRRTILLVHGFLGSAQDKWFKILTNKLLEWENVNVISVDWENGFSNPLYYHQTALNTEYVALTIQKRFSHIIKLWKRLNRSLDSWGPLHFIGLSMGAHIVGQTAALLKQKENLVVDRVTALDPAEPCFEDADMPLRLNRTNARFVDVIHTDGALGRNLAFGLRDPIGDADFYVNGGSRQPGCAASIIIRTKRGYMNYVELIQHAFSNGHCHHQRALLLFIESLKQTTAKQCKFWAHPWRLGSNRAETQRVLREKCDKFTCPELGINAELFNSYNKNNNNIYYVATTGEEPYCNI